MFGFPVISLFNLAFNYIGVFNHLLLPNALISRATPCTKNRAVSVALPCSIDLE